MLCGQYVLIAKEDDQGYQVPKKWERCTAVIENLGEPEARASDFGEHRHGLTAGSGNTGTR